MAFTPFVETDAPTMAAFNEKFAQAILSAEDGALEKGTKIEIGSYVGTGKHGQSNPCRLSFAFEPKLIVYLGERASDDPIDSVFHDPYWLRVLPSKLTTDYSELRGFVYTYDSAYRIYGKISPDGKTVSWYSPEGAYEQYNFSGTTYYFFAIG